MLLLRNPYRKSGLPFKFIFCSSRAISILGFRATLVKLLCPTTPNSPRMSLFFCKYWQEKTSRAGADSKKREEKVHVGPGTKKKSEQKVQINEEEQAFYAFYRIWQSSRTRCIECGGLQKSRSTSKFDVRYR